MDNALHLADSNRIVSDSGPPERRRKKKRLKPGLIRAAKAARWADVSLRTWRTWDSGGLVPRPLRVGGAVLWSVADLVLWRELGCPPRDVFDYLKQPKQLRK